MAFKWEVAPTDVFPQMAEKYTQAVFQSGRNIAYDRAEDMENWAKENAPWKDRTGDARERLHATVEETGPIGTIVLSHGVDYGIWLEVKNAGAYAIIAPAIDYWAPIVMRDLQRMMNLGLVSR
jgi:hypothetical protein